MKLYEIESSNIAKAGWDASTGLVLEFKTGMTYSYPTVTKETYQEFCQANSKGRFFHANIKSLPFSKIQVGAEILDAARAFKVKVDTEIREAGSGDSVGEPVGSA